MQTRRAWRAWRARPILILLKNVTRRNVQSPI